MQQIRTYQTAQLRAAPDSNGRTLVGLAIPYNSLSRDLGGFKERFMPGSVTKSVQQGEVVALYNHDTSKPIASQRSGNLKLTDSADGLHVEMELHDDVSYVRDLIAQMGQGEATGMSFGFGRADVTWTKENGVNIAEVREAELGEVSPLIGVPPAYPATALALRSAAGVVDKSDAERYGIDLISLAGIFLAIKEGLPLSTSEEENMQRAKGLFAQVRRPLLEQAQHRAAGLLLD